MPANQFASFFGERVGFKSGVALTREEIVDHLGAMNPVAQAILSVADEPIPLRAHEIEDAFQRLLYRLGSIDSAFVGHGPTLLDIKYRAHAESHCHLEQVLKLLGETHFDQGKLACSDGFNKDAFYALVASQLPRGAIPIAIELVELVERSERASPWDWYSARHVEWRDLVQLADLFSSESLATQHGTFLDQRFIDYLASNFSRVEDMNWRKFEGLSAEFLGRNGYDVDIGPGRGDGGVDIRAWRPGAATTGPPVVLVQCKRQREKVGKVVVKALWADVVDEKATSGLIVTSSAISPGAEAVRRARGYPIQVADRATLRCWLEQMRTPGQGIILGT